MRGESQAAQKHHDQDNRQPPVVVEMLSEGVEKGMDELCRVLSPPPIHWSKGSAVFQLCPRRSWLTVKLGDAAVRQRNTKYACEITLQRHISDLEKVQEVDTIPRITTVGVEDTYPTSASSRPHPALSNVTVIAPPGPRHTMKGSAIVVIGVDRGSDGRDNGTPPGLPRAVSRRGGFRELRLDGVLRCS
jgi:hypothetical protein